MVPQVLKLQEIEPPPELAAALSADFLGRLSIENPPPVRVAIPPETAHWGGYCSGGEYAEKGEIVIADWHHHQGWRVVQGIQHIYLHETAHRLLSPAQAKIENHGIEFFALQLFLFKRAGKKKGGWPWILSSDLYDCQNCLEPGGIAGVPSLGESIDFAMVLALELADQKITAELATQEICRRAQGWREEIAAEPGRRAAAQKAAREKFEVLQTALAVAHDKIFWWRLYFGAASFLAAAVFSLAISAR